MSTRSGACVRRARLAAVLGRPMPTKQAVPPRSARAAATVIISSAVQAPAGTRHDTAARRSPDCVEPVRERLAVRLIASHAR